MKITKNNVEELPIPIREKRLLSALLRDLETINLKTKEFDIIIDWEDKHSEYSLERTDPCPDYYGMYTLRREDNYESLGIEMDIDTLDVSMCLLQDYIESII